MSFLKVDYDQAVAQAKRLEQAASFCEQSLKDLKRERGGSEGFWKGDSGSAMREQMETAEKKLQDTKRQLTDTAAAIRQVAEELREKDEELSDMIGNSR